MRNVTAGVIILFLLCSTQASFAAPEGKKGPSDRAYERANENASFLRDEAKKEKKAKEEKVKAEKVKAEKKAKKEKKSKEEMRDKTTEQMVNKLGGKKGKAEREMKKEMGKTADGTEE